jgi:hypothetical protein
MRTTISIPETLITRVRVRAPGVTLSAFAREAMAERLDRLERQELARSMSEGYATQSAGPDGDDWAAVETEGWE